MYKGDLLFEKERQMENFRLKAVRSSHFSLIEVRDINKNTPSDFSPNGVFSF